VSDGEKKYYDVVTRPETKFSATPGKGLSRLSLIARAIAKEGHFG
jgi:hypothetical protein